VAGRIRQRFGFEHAAVGVIELDQPVDDHLCAGVVDGPFGQRGPHCGAVHDPQAGVHQIPRRTCRGGGDRRDRGRGPGHPVAHRFDPVMDHRDHRRPPRIRGAQLGFGVAQRGGEVLIVEVVQLLE
jgi:hypothetical protein